ncbi:ABC transporter ATP-binding protein [Microbacterium sp. TNHR37B]|uniref:ABC transporter ATP-binding protein n=1 Tax=Microbacterium sp. TNHR37B TaxID=1775956 RepID=UPI0007B20693|nr:ABC transporter ATP-binding protein [Microbacterium sp. TNHR37B]KZE91467.1 Oligopeptide transport ATP-binding protein OppF [Microbacterium sp. TNHR37B]
MTTTAAAPPVLLGAEGISVAYGSRPVLSDVSLSVSPGDSLGLVGESGAGKTTVLRALLGLLPPTTGTVRFAGEALSADGRRVASRPTRRAFRRAVQPVFQDPYSSLDPRMTIGRSIAEPLRSLGVRGDHRARVAELLAAVELPADAADRYPEAFSGGQRQRIAIARALAPRPRILLADEPVSALDTSVRMQVIELLQRLAHDQGIGFLLVSHDLTIVAALCDRMAVLESGRIVEEGPTGRVLTAPAHPYTRRLRSSVPRLPTRSAGE